MTHHCDEYSRVGLVNLGLEMGADLLRSSRAMRKKPVWRVFIVAWAAVQWACCSSASAETWPVRPIHVIIPFGAGSVIDAGPRIIFDRVSGDLSQPIVIENRPGAGSTIGTRMVAHAAPDGYTLLVNSNALTIAPAMYPSLSYSVTRDFAAIVPIGTVPNVLVTSSLHGIRTLAGFVAAGAKKAPLTFASLGLGSATHINSERFVLSAALPAKHVPYSQAAQLIPDLLEGRIDFCLCAIGSVMAYIRDHRLVALGMGTSKRSPLLPDVPTTLEAGFKDSDYTLWEGLFAPAKTPPGIIEKLHDQVSAAVQTPTVRDRLLNLGVEPFPLSSDEFASYVRHEIVFNAELVKMLGLKAD